MGYFLAVSAEGILGIPEPAVGVRVVFEPALLFAARERLLGHPVPRELDGRDGLVIYDDPRGASSWPCRVWEVSDPDGQIRFHPESMWFRSRAVTVVRELPDWSVFGDRGSSVVTVIEQARQMTDPQAQALADAFDGWPRPPSTDWWTEQVASGRARAEPIGNALEHVRVAVDQAARVAGQELFAFDEGDGVDYLADVAWQTARSMAAAAALAAGTADDNADLAFLFRSWVDVMGPAPGGAVEP